MLMPLAQRAVPPLAAAVVSGSTASDSTTTAKAKAATAAGALDVLGQLAASAGDDDSDVAFALGTVTAALARHHAGSCHERRIDFDIRMSLSLREAREACVLVSTTHRARSNCHDGDCRDKDD